MQRVVDVRFGFLGEIDGLGVTATLDVEDAGIRPDMFIVANEQAGGVGRQGGLAGSREPEENGRSVGLGTGGGRQCMERCPFRGIR